MRVQQVNAVRKDLPVPGLHFRYDRLLTIGRQFQAPYLAAVSRLQVIDIPMIWGELTLESAALRALRGRAAANWDAEQLKRTSPARAEVDPLTRGIETWRYVFSLFSDQDFWLTTCRG